VSRPLALITGGTSGIGRGIALALAPRFDLALGYATDESKASQAVEEIHRAYPDTQIKVFRALLTNAEEATAFYRQVVSDSGRAPSVLVNNAGRLSDGLFLGSDLPAYLSVLNEHLVVSLALTHAALKPMYREKFGRILNLSSISATYAKRGQSNYAAAKAGIEGFTRTLALEVAHRGVTVNAIAPGLIDTPLTRPLLERIQAEEPSLRDRVPVGRAGTPAEVGALAAFLCSDEASYITGAVIPIDGGRSLGDSRS